MQTLIELYDERPLENILGVEVFRPNRVVYVCPDGTDEKRVQRQLREYFRNRGFDPAIRFVKANIYDTGAILNALRRTVEQESDCAMDITLPAARTRCSLPRGFSARRGRSPFSPTVGRRTSSIISAMRTLLQISPVSFA